MDEEQREYNFPTEDSDDTKSPPEKSPEDARAAMQQSLQQFANGVAQSLAVTHEVAKIVGPALLNFAKKAQEISVAVKPVLEAFQQWMVSFSEAILQWQIPTISEERKQELILSHKKWGEYGWTLPPSAPIKFFYDAPANIKEANQKMKPYCSRKAMDELFATLQRASVKKEDLNTAIFCYDNRQYKACALVLLGVIDAKLIRKQNRNGYRCTGSRAAKKIREKFENERTTEAFSTMLHCVNLFSCIETGFAPAENFKAEPYTFNRNYLAHGMTRRPVRQRDCIQLFFALYNLTVFLKFS